MPGTDTSMRCLITFWLILAGIIGSIAHAGTANVPSLNDNEITQLNKFATLIDRGVGEKYLLSYLRSKSCPARAMSAALLYRGDPGAYQSNLYYAFSVDDYQARARGEYNFVSKETLLDVMRRIEARYPRITDKRSQLLLAFCAFKDENAWIRTNDANISLARFFRSAFLAAVYKETSLDAAAIANAIDQNTQRNH